jgi:hypothetical protein
LIKYIVKYITSIFKRKEVVIETKVVVVEVLSRSAFNRLKQQLEPPVIGSSDNDQSAAYRLGIQRGLSVLEKNFVQ